MGWQPKGGICQQDHGPSPLQVVLALPTRVFESQCVSGMGVFSSKIEGNIIPYSLVR